MKIVVVGGTGLIGAKVVALLREQGHEAVPASPRLGINTITGEGLAGALVGADVVIDVTNPPPTDADAQEFFETSTRNLLSAESAAGVGHHVVLSIVGIDASDTPYFQAKVVQEHVVTAGAIPYSIIRSTQFFEFIEGIADGSSVGNEVHVAPVAFQPIAADDVVRILAEVAVSPPLNGRIEIAGPDKLRFDEVIRKRLQARGDARQIIADPQAPYFGGVPKEETLVPLGEARLGQQHFAEWLSQSAT